MCGITGFNWSDKALLQKASDAIAHRGPDAEGFYCDKFVSLGHRRLSILDLSAAGAQPMHYKHFTIVFNGEIYNYEQIKLELLNLGHYFSSTSDTEVILHAYEQWGSSCVNKFNGMWALCVYDKKGKRLFLSRDRFGIKPLYYYCDNGAFAFASELSAIRKLGFSLQIDLLALNQYFFQKYILSSHTIYKEVKQLAPGHSALFSLKTKELNIWKYYSINKWLKAAYRIPLEKRINAITNLIDSAVTVRTVSDVPVGSFLSGGVDSSIISAQLSKTTRKLKTFSIGFKEVSFDELPYSKRVSSFLNTDHFTETVALTDELVKTALDSLDEPLADPSFIPTFSLSKMTKQEVTVSLSGDAADEIFGGYDTYLAFKVKKLIPGFFFKLAKPIVDLLPDSSKKVSLVFKLKRFVTRFDSGNNTMNHLNNMAQFPDKAREQLLKATYFKESKALGYGFYPNSLMGLQLLDIATYLPGDILRKVDRASMLNGLEARVPFLDYRLVPLVLSLPDNYKMHGLRGKVFLKQYSKEFLPPEVISRGKRGFSVPLTSYIKSSSLMRTYLTKDEFYKHGFLRRNYVEQLLSEFNSGKDNTRELWTIFIWNYWWYRNHEKNGANN